MLAILWYYFIFIKRIHYTMQKITLLLLIILSLVSSVSAATRYVSDDLYTYVHSGPGTKYKIIGSVNSGDTIELIQTNKNAGFSEIKDSRGRSGWINSKYVSRNSGLKVRLGKLEVEFAALNTELRTAKDNVKSHSNEVRELKKTNSKLNEELKHVKALNANLNEKLDTEKIDLLMRWFSYGGMVGGIGLLLGLILPSLVPNRRKRSRW